MERSQDSAHQRMDYARSANSPRRILGHASRRQRLVRSLRQLPESAAQEDRDELRSGRHVVRWRMGSDMDARTRRLPGVDWESCMTMNDTWNYRSDDHRWKSGEQLIRNLVDIT